MFLSCSKKSRSFEGIAAAAAAKQKVCKQAKAKAKLAASDTHAHETKNKKVLGQNVTSIFLKKKKFPSTLRKQQSKKALMRVFFPLKCPSSLAF